MMAPSPAWPVQSSITKFRDEFKSHVREGKCHIGSEVGRQMSEVSQ